MAIALQTIRSLSKQLENIKGSDKEEYARTMADIQAERMAVERLKLPVIWELADDMAEEGKSVAIFLNFRHPRER
jgi:hypothetical protein